MSVRRNAYLKAHYYGIDYTRFQNQFVIQYTHNSAPQMILPEDIEDFRIEANVFGDDLLKAAQIMPLGVVQTVKSYNEARNQAHFYLHSKEIIPWVMPSTNHSVQLGDVLACIFEPNSGITNRYITARLDFIRDGQKINPSCAVHRIGTVVQIYREYLTLRAHNQLPFEYDLGG